jgi:sulfonate transport system ATP-binding protein
VLDAGRIAVDLRPGLPQARSHRDPAFQETRELLLRALGVEQ